MMRKGKVQRKLSRAKVQHYLSFPLTVQNTTNWTISGNVCTIYLLYIRFFYWRGNHANAAEEFIYSSI